MNQGVHYQIGQYLIHKISQQKMGVPSGTPHFMIEGITRFIGLPEASVVSLACSGLLACQVSGLFGYYSYL